MQRQTPKSNKTMAKKIIMLPPFDVLTGNLSGGQTLTYAPDNRSAWYADKDKRTYANNYRASYVGVRRGDGKTFFQVKKRTAVLNSPAQLMAQALLGASKLCADQAYHDATAHVKFGQAWAYDRGHGNVPQEWTLYHYIKDFYYTRILGPKLGEVTLPNTGSNPYVVGNPWVAGSVPASSKYIPTISTMYIVKFWVQLAQYGSYYYIGSAIGLSEYDGSDPTSGSQPFSNIVSSSLLNNLGLTLQTISTTQYVKYNGLFLLLADRTTYADSTYTPNPDEKFYTTAVAP